ncbi:Histone-like DNA-binding protein [uncultured Caudovirales phage]|uniref:Histone-like DNA-binding protein n=1 Tax=uncultured Caudovirales phage TaxID=2100421 RepID=A0A6J5RHZ8_9CAUD|nr:Histone-like DNA-binding protein [uncultured Caudovirales phage]
MNKIPTSISKRVLWRYVNIKIKRIIHHYHVFSVITILFEEMLKDLISGKNINIFNLGIFSLKQNKPRLHYDISKKTFAVSNGRKVMRLALSPQVKKIICKHVDLDRTFKDD